MLNNDDKAVGAFRQLQRSAKDSQSKNTFGDWLCALFVVGIFVLPGSYLVIRGILEISSGDPGGWLSAVLGWLPILFGGLLLFLLLRKRKGP